MSIVQTMLPRASARLFKIQHTAPLIEAAQLLIDKDCGLIVVCSDAGLIRGVITKSDVVRQISRCQGRSCTTPLSEVMTQHVVTCHPDQELHDVWLLMKTKQLKQVPIVSLEWKPLGLLHARDALEQLLKEVEYEDVLLRDYVMGVGYH
jgi:CBS domain-containing protein